MSEASFPESRLRRLLRSSAGRQSGDEHEITANVGEVSDVPRLRASLRERLAHQLPDTQTEAVGAVATEICGRLSLVADLPLQIRLSMAGQASSGADVEVTVTGTLRASRAEAERVLRWDERTFGGILVGEVVTDLTVEYDPFGPATVRARVPGGSSA